MTAVSQVQVTRAWTRARRLYTSPGFRKAYLAGARASLEGLPADACPYKRRGGWKAWRSAWLAGHRSIAPSSGDR